MLASRRGTASRGPLLMTMGQKAALRAMRAAQRKVIMIVRAIMAKKAVADQRVRFQMLQDKNVYSKAAMRGRQEGVGS